MDVSSKGRAFIYAHEGNPSTVYRDPVGIPTVGPGLAAHNPIVKRMLGKLKPGTRYAPEQLDRVFAAVLEEYVEPAVEKGLPGAEQHEFDAGGSACYNLGTGAIQWKWADLWRAGKKSAGWRWLGENYNTAKGKKLPGLVRRRKEEAHLGLTGRYTGVSNVPPEGVAREATKAAPKTGPDPVVTEAQQILTAKGFDPGAIDGWMGEKTSAALLAYQEAHPHLVNDGILGPATLSQLRRDAEAAQDMVKDVAGKGGGTAAAGGVAGFISGLPWHWIIAGVVLVFIAWTLWRHRDVIQRRFNTLMGRKVVL